MRARRLLTLIVLALTLSPALSHAAGRAGEQTIGGTTLSARYDGETDLVVTAINRATGINDPLTVRAPIKIDAQLRMDCTPGARNYDPAKITVLAYSAELDPGKNSNDLLTDEPAPQGTEITATFSDQDELRYKDWRCLTGTVDGTTFTFYFDGYGPFTTAIAKQAVRDDLKRLYGSTVMKRLVWLECPQIEFGMMIDDEAAGLCEYQIGRGSNTRAGAYIVTAPENSPPIAERASSNRYSQRVVNCPSQYERSEPFRARSRIVNKRLRTPRILCGSLFIKADLATSAHLARANGKRRFSAGEHGTNRAGFEKSVSYPCRFTARRNGNQVHYKVRCANQLGNRIFYDFTIATTPPKPKPKRSRSGGGGGNQFAGKTCSEIGHSYTVTPGTDREHDADGDGIACESQ